MARSLCAMTYLFPRVYLDRAPLTGTKNGKTNRHVPNKFVVEMHPEVALTDPFTNRPRPRLHEQVYGGTTSSLSAIRILTPLPFAESGVPEPSSTYAKRKSITRG